MTLLTAHLSSFCLLILQKIGRLTNSEREQHNEEKHNPVENIIMFFLLKFAYIEFHSHQC